MQIRPQDVLVACKLLTLGLEWTYDGLAGGLYLSRSEAHASVCRCQSAGIVVGGGRCSTPRVRRRKLLDLLLAVPQVFVADLGPVGDGLPTAESAGVLDGRFEPTGRIRLAWPTTLPNVRLSELLVEGQLVSPLYPTATLACAADDRLYEILALVDVLRVGSPSSSRRARSLLRAAVSGSRQAITEKITIST